MGHRVKKKSWRSASKFTFFVTEMTVCNFIKAF